MLMTPISGHYQNNAKKGAQRASLASFMMKHFLKIIVRVPRKSTEVLKPEKESDLDILDHLPNHESLVSLLL